MDQGLTWTKWLKESLTLLQVIFKLTIQKIMKGKEIEMLIRLTIQ